MAIELRHFARRLSVNGRYVETSGRIREEAVFHQEGGSHFLYKTPFGWAVASDGEESFRLAGTHQTPGWLCYQEGKWLEHDSSGQWVASETGYSRNQLGTKNVFTPLLPHLEEKATRRFIEREQSLNRTMSSPEWAPIRTGDAKTVIVTINGLSTYLDGKYRETWLDFFLSQLLALGFFRIFIGPIELLPRKRFPKKFPLAGPPPTGWELSTHGVELAVVPWKVSIR